MLFCWYKPIPFLPFSLPSLSSLLSSLSWPRKFATMVTWRHTSPLYYGTQSEPRENTQATSNSKVSARQFSAVDRNPFECSAWVLCLFFFFIQTSDKKTNSTIETFPLKHGILQPWAFSRGLKCFGKKKKRLVSVESAWPITWNIGDNLCDGDRLKDDFNGFVCKKYCWRRLRC